MSERSTVKNLYTLQDPTKQIVNGGTVRIDVAESSSASLSSYAGLGVGASGPGGIHLLNGLYDANCDLQPVLAIICIPKDIQEWPVSDKMRSSANIKGHSGDWAHPSTARPADALLRKAAEIINDGSKVTIFVGRGALGASEEVAHLGRDGWWASRKGVAGQRCPP